MKNASKIILAVLLLITTLSFKSTTNLTEIPKKGVFDIPAKSEISFWKNTKHASFSIHLENHSKQNSCEAYTVKNGKEKWISPSLLANGELDFTVPKDAHLYFKNFSEENLKITYNID
jgi:hypothetical protein